MTTLEKIKTEIINEKGTFPKEHYVCLIDKYAEQEPCDDVVSRQAVLDLCDSTDPEYKVIHFKEDVECLPSVRPQEQEPTSPCDLCKFNTKLMLIETNVSGYAQGLKESSKTGHWILQPSNKEQGERDFIWWKCSECGQVIFSETEKDRREYHAFCGRCGAKMVEPQESEE